MSAVTTSRPVERARSATKDAETARRRTGPDADCRRSATASGVIYCDALSTRCRGKGNGANMESPSRIFSTINSSVSPS